MLTSHWYIHQQKNQSYCCSQSNNMKTIALHNNTNLFNNSSAIPVSPPINTSAWMMVHLLTGLGTPGYFSIPPPHNCFLYVWPDHFLPANTNTHTHTHHPDPSLLCNLSGTCWGHTPPSTLWWTSATKETGASLHSFHASDSTCLQSVLSVPSLPTGGCMLSLLGQMEDVLSPQVGKQNLLDTRVHCGVSPQHLTMQIAPLQLEKN